MERSDIRVLTTFQTTVGIPDFATLNPGYLLGRAGASTVIRSSAACSRSRTGGAHWTAVRVRIEPFHRRCDQ
jgi:hypothetical protein